MFKRSPVHIDHEKKILINMIVSSEFLCGILPVLKINYFKSRYSRILAKWIIEYYERYKESPKNVIEDIFFNKKNAIKDEDDAKLIGSLIANLSDEYTTTNTKYLLDTAIEYLKKRSLEVLVEDVQTNIQSNNLLKAEQNITKYKRVTSNTIEDVDIIEDTDAIIKAFNEEKDSLFCFPGEMRDIFGFCNRGDFISFLAFTKRGKTWALLFSMECALTYGNNVLFISMEMTREQVLRRIWQSFTGRPKKSMDVRIPYFEEVDDGYFEIQYSLEHREGFPLDRNGIEREQKRIKKYLREGKAKLLNLPANSCSVEDLEAHFDILEYYYSFIPDVIFIDYADLIVVDKNMEYRHQIDYVWKNLRRLALERNICIFTVSQSNRGSINSDVSEENVAEDIRKLAHVTRMIGINQSRVDRRNSVFRMEVLSEREGEGVNKELLCLSCLDIGKFYIDALPIDKVLYDKKDEAKEKRDKKNGSFL